MNKTIKDYSGTIRECTPKKVNYDRKITLKTNGELYDKCKKYAADNGMSFAALFRVALENEISRSK